MNEIALIADRLFDVESYDADHHYETYRYTDIEALIIQYAGETYGIDADTLYSVVDFDLLDIDPAARLAIDSLTWSDDHVYTISKQAEVRDLFTTALTEATGLDASFFNLSDDVIDEFTHVIIDQTLYGSIANEFWNLSLDTWEDVWTGTEEEWAAEQLTWTRDLDIVYQIADAFFWPSNLYASEYVDFSTIDSAYVIQTLLDNMTWVDESVTPRVVDEANTKEVDVITNVGAALLQDTAAITSINAFLPELVDKAHLYYLANDIEIIEHYDAEAITAILNGMNVYQFVLDHAQNVYGVTNDQLLAVIDLTTSTDLDTIATNAVTSVTWNDDGSFTIGALDSVRAEVYTLLDTILVSGTATDAGVTDELIDEYITAMTYEVFFGQIPEYEHNGFVNWLADIDIVSVAKDLVMERFAVDETVVDPIFEAVDVWELSYYTLSNLQYTYDTATLEDIYYIDDSSRQYLYTETRSFIESTTVDLGGITSADISDAQMDIIIDEMINILAFGDPSDFNDAEWLTYMTDMITDPNLTEEQVIDFLIYEQEGWTDWMFANPIEYENWLADYATELEAWSLKFEYLLAEYVTDPTELEQWEAFDDPIDDWQESSAEIFTGREQKEFEALNAIEATYAVDPRHAEWVALQESLTEIYWTRVNQGLEQGSTSRLAQAEPALLQRCDKDRQDYGESLYTQNSDLVFSKADLYYMGDFLDRAWEYIWEEWYVTETSSSGVLA